MLGVTIRPDHKETYYIYLMGHISAAKRQRMKLGSNLRVLQRDLRRRVSAVVEEGSRSRLRGRVGVVVGVADPQAGAQRGGGARNIRALLAAL